MDKRSRSVFTACGLLLAALTMCGWGLGAVAKTQEGQPAAAQPPIPIGPVKMEDVFHYNEEYKPRAEAYVPIASGIAFLKDYPKKVRIEIFYGSWCGDSRNHVPTFLKVISSANNPNFEIAIWAVDQAKQEPADMIKLRRITRVPTFIVLQSEKELGRITESPSSSIEEDLYRILEPTLNRPGALNK